MINIRKAKRDSEGSCNACGAHPFTHDNAPPDVFVIAAGPGGHTTSFRLCPFCLAEHQEQINALQPAAILTHIVPVGNGEPLHFAGSHCWCHPIPDTEDATLIIHNAKDTREKWERQGIPTGPASAWVTIAELSRFKV